MVLTEQEESLISIVRALPPLEAERILDWARSLAELSGGRPVDWSDAWTAEDLADATSAAIRRLDEDNPGQVDN